MCVPWGGWIVKGQKRRPIKLGWISAKAEGFLTHWPDRLKKLPVHLFSHPDYVCHYMLKFQLWSMWYSWRFRWKWSAVWLARWNLWASFSTKPHESHTESSWSMGWNMRNTNDIGHDQWNVCICKCSSASLWSQDCGASGYLCEACTSRLHSGINLFHSPLLWKIIIYDIIAITDSP